MANRLTPDELFREFATTDSPFEKWQLFSHITNEATFVYLPHHFQRNLCNLQFGLFELMQSKSPDKVSEARELMKWILSHQSKAKEIYKTTNPVSFYLAMKHMTPDEIKTTQEENKNLFLIFNPSHLTFKNHKKKSFIKCLIAKLKSWRD